MVTTTTTFNFSIDTIMVVVAMNIALTTIHYFLFKLRESKKWIWPDKALNVVNFLMTMIGFIIANRMPTHDPGEGPK